MTGPCATPRVLDGDGGAGLDVMMGDGPGLGAEEGVETSFGSSGAGCGTGAGRRSAWGSARGGGAGAGSAAGCGRAGDRFRAGRRRRLALFGLRRLANFGRHLDDLNVDRQRHRRGIRRLLEQRQEAHL